MKIFKKRLILAANDTPDRKKHRQFAGILTCAQASEKSPHFLLSIFISDQKIFFLKVTRY